jgi:hypothetical protein
MLTAAEGQELLDEVRRVRELLPEAPLRRVEELAVRIAHDAKVAELSDYLMNLVAQVPPEGSEEPVQPGLFEEIRRVADLLAKLG